MRISQVSIKATLFGRMENQDMLRAFDSHATATEGRPLELLCGENAAHWDAPR
jgi:hypothetical protein